ncbi:MAG: sigma-54 dependent transcriptional regulator [Acidobacteriota bacterium]
MTDPRTVLLVDDDQSFRRVMEFQLQEDGFRVLTAANASAALQRFQADRVDLVLTDVKMPESGGMELLARLRRLQPDLPIVMLTAHGTIESAVEAMKLGAFDYLTKPFTREQLRVILSKTFDVAALKQENKRLRAVVAERFSFTNMIAGSRAMHDVTDLASRVANTETTVLLYGESGTGKELLAKAIHFHSDRSRHPFIVVNCAAIPESLIESELFGHRRGSFTGAVSDKQGKFEAANKGTIFLDEIGELPLLMQVKILRVLQNREIDKVGEARPIKIDVRIIAATNRNLEKMVSDGGFRDDLYYRLAVVALRMPPLRERTDDIPLLVEHFVDTHTARLRRSRPTITRDVYSAFNLYAWPGNIRELENIVERALVLDRDGVLSLEDLPDRLRAREQGLGRLRIELPDEGLSLETLECDLLRAALEKHDWNQTKAAAYLDITRSALLYRMQKLGLEKPKPDSDTHGTSTAPG